MKTLSDWILGLIAMSAFAFMLAMALTGTTFVELYEQIVCYL